LLLEKQDVLRVLEKRLNEYDDGDRAKANRRILKPHQIKPREELLEEIEKAFNSYGAWNSPSHCPRSEGKMLLWSLGLITRFHVQPPSSSLRSS
jgi:inactivated superfamily I helicase